MHVGTINMPSPLKHQLHRKWKSLYTFSQISIKLAIFSQPFIYDTISFKLLKNCQYFLQS
jgi:hypothetical protein